MSHEWDTTVISAHSQSLLFVEHLDHSVEPSLGSFIFTPCTGVELPETHWVMMQPKDKQFHWVRVSGSSGFALAINRSTPPASSTVGSLPRAYMMGCFGVSAAILWSGLFDFVFNRVLKHRTYIPRIRLTSAVGQSASSPKI